MNTTSSRRCLRWGALLLLVALPGVTAHARTHHNEAWARDHFAAAERMREALNGRLPADRTRHDYQRVINAYRNVYFGAPTSTKADPSVVAVAETLVEMGRRFDDDKILNEAIAQYKFLRKEYPGSKYRCDALFTIGEIYQDDLNDTEQARGAFAEFLKRYPHNRLVEDAQQAIAQLDRQAEEEKKAEAQKKSGKEVAEKKSAKDSSGKDSLAKDVSGPDLSKQDSSRKDSASKDADSRADASAQESPEHRSGRLPRVTGIRHWSTPDYTRVAIDLESEVKFGSQRIASPDRIFFDLRDTKLASTLVGKTFDVDDGFLKKIRVAQFQPGRTRVVLEVDDLSDYEAFLLPNPYRLIIDIHGKDAHGKDASKLARARTKDVTTVADVEATPKAGSNSGAKSDSPATDTKTVEAKNDAQQPDKAGEADSDQSKTENKSGIASLKKSSKRHTSVTRTTIDPKTGVKKVIVDADDDEDAPVQVAKTEMPPAHASVSTVSAAIVKNVSAVDVKNGIAKSDRVNSDVAKTEAAKTEAVKTVAEKSDDTTETDSAIPGDETVIDPPAASHTHSNSRLGSGHKPTDLEVREARPTAGGDRSLIRALGLKIGKIVIDPGHGGHDTGTIGPDGLQEKDLVLEVGRKLGKLLETRLGAEVVYTRKDDTFIPLETRTAIANQQRADLFISIHANSSSDETARGVETYYLNFTSSPEALEVAARENAVSEKSIYELQDLVKKIALKEKIEESREFAGDVQESLHNGLASKSPAIRNRGVKKAPFIVLIGANMPSILAEISFVSNPTDEHRLETSEYRQRIAESLYRGIAKYVNGLSGVKLASKMDKAAGQ